MRSKILSLGVLLGVALGIAVATPTSGLVNRMNASGENDVRVPSSKADGVPGENDEFVLECRANERTSILIKGDHKPVCDLEVLVYEVSPGKAEGRLIARDKGTRDLIGTTWVPPRTATYRIVIRNPSMFTKENPYNSCYVTIK
jgi:hypothetical protein